jgi:uncharacterized protein
MVRAMCPVDFPAAGRAKNFPRGFHILAKPIGPLCNLNCTYCYYTEKRALFAKGENYRMSEQVLDAFIRKYIRSMPQATPEVSFAWQGGEPMLMGLEFFHEAVRLQKKYSNGKKITNALQTNGVLLDDTWCAFLAENDFLVGLSLDGPEDIHNRYRVDHQGKGSFKAVMKGLDLLKRRGVAYNVMASVTRESALRPWDVYHFFKEQEVEFIQFIPIVERVADADALRLGLDLAVPPEEGLGHPTEETPWSVEPESYGNFLNTIFDEWVRNDVGTVFVVNFEWALMAWLGGEATVCQFSRRCGRSLAIEHDGNLYSCDHYVYPRYLLGNIRSVDLAELVDSPQQSSFGARKETALPAYCQTCEHLFACRGECPKHRFLKTPDGQPGLNYLCEGYKKYFSHINGPMKIMKALLENNQPASYVMDALRGPLAIRLR